MSMLTLASAAGATKAAGDILAGNELSGMVDSTQAFAKYDKKGRDYMLQNI